MKKVIKEQTKIEIEDCEEIIRYINEEEYFIETETYVEYITKIHIADVYVKLFEEKKTEKAANFLMKIGYAHNRQGEYNKALEYYEKALKIREKILEKEHPSTATIYNNMAGVYQALREK